MKDKRIAIASVSASVILMASAAQADTRPKPWQSINMSEAPVTVGIPDGEWDGIRIGVSESGAPN
ncbi:hypothetical protein, partial [Priestia megaterium]|uniref:hypothetical protein n=1 Tax=Priestia megaterium TaxID=1404 RepID=UPI0035B66AB3